MSGYIIHAGGGAEPLNYARISIEDAARLYFAGESLEIRSCFVVCHPPGKSPHIIRQVPTLKYVLPSLHFRAYRYLSKEGYSIDDVAGYVLMSKKEVAEILSRGKHRSISNKDERIFGARYYIKRGHEKSELHALKTQSRKEPEVRGKQNG